MVDNETLSKNRQRIKSRNCLTYYELEYYQNLKRAHLLEIFWDYEKETKMINSVKISEEKDIKEVTLAIILKFKNHHDQKSS